MRDINRVIQIKTGKKWTTSHTDTNPESIYQSLARDLIAKKINSCSYIRAIKRIQNYDGTITITVNYDNDTRSVYTVRE